MPSWTVIRAHLARFLWGALILTGLCAFLGYALSHDLPSADEERALIGLAASCSVWLVLGSGTYGILSSANTVFFWLTPMRTRFFLLHELRQRWYLIGFAVVLVPLVLVLLAAFFARGASMPAATYHLLLNILLFYACAIVVPARENMIGYTSWTSMLFPFRVVARTLGPLLFVIGFGGLVAERVTDGAVSNLALRVVDSVLSLGAPGYVIVSVVSPVSGFLLQGPNYGYEFAGWFWTAGLLFYLVVCGREVVRELSLDTPTRELSHYEQWLDVRQEAFEEADDYDRADAEAEDAWREYYAVTYEKDSRNADLGAMRYDTRMTAAEALVSPERFADNTPPVSSVGRAFWLAYHYFWSVAVATAWLIYMNFWAGTGNAEVVGWLCLLGAHAVAAYSASRLQFRFRLLSAFPVSLWGTMPGYLQREIVRRGPADMAIAALFAHATGTGGLMVAAGYLSLLAVRATSLVALYQAALHEAGMPSNRSLTQLYGLFGGLVYAAIAYAIEEARAGLGRDPIVSDFAPWLAGFGLHFLMVTLLLTTIARGAGDWSFMGHGPLDDDGGEVPLAQ